MLTNGVKCANPEALLVNELPGLAISNMRELLRTEQKNKSIFQDHY